MTPLDVCDEPGCNNPAVPKISAHGWHGSDGIARVTCAAHCHHDYCRERGSWPAKEPAT